MSKPQQQSGGRSSWGLARLKRQLLLMRRRKAIGPADRDRRKADVFWLRLELKYGQALVHVRDTGLGTPAELLPHVFDLFVQGDRSRSRSEGGLRAGLTVVKSLVAAAGKLLLNALCLASRLAPGGIKPQVYMI